MRYLLILASALFLGCGGSEASPVAPPAPDASSSPAPDEGLPVTEADAAAPSDAGPSTKPVDASSAPTDDRIDPIELGHAWTYNVQVLGYYPTCDNGVQTATAL